MSANITVEDAVGVKCPRCWKVHRVEVNFDHLCDRCCEVILEDYPEHESVPGIRAAHAKQLEIWGPK